MRGYRATAALTAVHEPSRQCIQYRWRDAPLGTWRCVVPWIAGMLEALTGRPAQRGVARDHVQLYMAILIKVLQEA